MCLVATLSYFSIPCFLMLTGAFVDKRIDNTFKFYKKSFVKLGIPTVIFSVLYSVWYIFLAVKKGNASSEIFRVVKYWKTGWLGHPVWYMHMLVGLYALIPIVQKAIAKTEANVFAVSVLFCVWAVISSYTSTFSVTYNLGRVVLLLSYVIMGHAIKSTCTSKNNKNAVALIVCGFIFLVINGFLVYRCLRMDLNWRTWGNNFSPFVMLGSILIFAGFCKIDYTREVKLARYTFIIYLLHKGVLEVAQFVVGKILPDSRSVSLVLIVVLIEVIVVFIASLGLSLAYFETAKIFSKTR